MITRVDWVLRPVNAVTLPRSYRLALIKDLHARMGLTLGGEQIPSTRFAGLVGARAQGDYVTFAADQFYHLSLSGLSEASAKLVSELDIGEEIACVDGRFVVCERSQQSTTYEVLYQQQVASEPTPQYRHQLKFTTPTAFSQRRLYLPLPIPELMLRSWLTSWNEFAPVYLGGDELIGYLSEVVAISRHRLQTTSMPIYKGWVTGFTGDVTLTLLKRTDTLLTQVVSLLVAY
ncbi:MAG: CRISPR system precrRNA processing endoribonuclease RAMP protein Cas6, partial [Cyanobacteria bacterium J06643_4]